MTKRREIIGGSNLGVTMVPESTRVAQEKSFGLKTSGVVQSKEYQAGSILARRAKKAVSVRTAPTAEDSRLANISIFEKALKIAESFELSNGTLGLIENVLHDLKDATGSLSEDLKSDMTKASLAFTSHVRNKLWDAVHENDTESYFHCKDESGSVRRSCRDTLDRNPNIKNEIIHALASGTSNLTKSCNLNKSVDYWSSQSLITARLLSAVFKMLPVTNSAKTFTAPTANELVSLSEMASFRFSKFNSNEELTKNLHNGIDSSVLDGINIELNLSDFNDILLENQIIESSPDNTPIYPLTRKSFGYLTKLSEIYENITYLKNIFERNEAKISSDNNLSGNVIDLEVGFKELTGLLSKQQEETKLRYQAVNRRLNKLGAGVNRKSFQVLAAPQLLLLSKSENIFHSAIEKTISSITTLIEAFDHLDVSCKEIDVSDKIKKTQKRLLTSKTFLKSVEKLAIFCNNLIEEIDYLALDAKSNHARLMKTLEAVFPEDAISTDYPLDTENLVRYKEKVLSLSFLLSAIVAENNPDLDLSPSSTLSNSGGRATETIEFLSDKLVDTLSTASLNEHEINQRITIGLSNNLYRILTGEKKSLGNFFKKDGSIRHSKTKHIAKDVRNLAKYSTNEGNRLAIITGALAHNSDKMRERVSAQDCDIIAKNVSTFNIVNESFGSINLKNCANDSEKSSKFASHHRRRKGNYNAQANFLLNNILALGTLGCKNSKMRHDVNSIIQTARHPDSLYSQYFTPRTSGYDLNLHLEDDSMNLAKGGIFRLAATKTLFKYFEQFENLKVSRAASAVLSSFFSHRDDPVDVSSKKWKTEELKTDLQQLSAALKLPLSKRIKKGKSKKSVSDASKVSQPTVDSDLGSLLIAPDSYIEANYESLIATAGERVMFSRGQTSQNNVQSWVTKTMVTSHDNLCAPIESIDSGRMGMLLTIDEEEESIPVGTDAFDGVEGIEATEVSSIDNLNLDDFEPKKVESTPEGSVTSNMKPKPSRRRPITATVHDVKEASIAPVSPVASPSVSPVASASPLASSEMRLNKWSTDLLDKPEAGSEKIVALAGDRTINLAKDEPVTLVTSIPHRGSETLAEPKAKNNDKTIALVEDKTVALVEDKTVALVAPVAPPAPLVSKSNGVITFSKPSGTEVVPVKRKKVPSFDKALANIAAVRANRAENEASASVSPVEPKASRAKPSRYNQQFASDLATAATANRKRIEPEAPLPSVEPKAESDKKAVASTSAADRGIDYSAKLANILRTSTAERTAFTAPIRPKRKKDVKILEVLPVADDCNAEVSNIYSKSLISAERNAEITFAPIVITKESSVIDQCPRAESISDASPVNTTPTRGGQEGNAKLMAALSTSPTVGTKPRPSILCHIDTEGSLFRTNIARVPSILKISPDHKRVSFTSDTKAHDSTRAEAGLRDNEERVESSPDYKRVSFASDTKAHDSTRAEAGLRDNEGHVNDETVMTRF